MPRWFFQITAASLVVAAAYHAAAVLIPSFGAMAYPSTYPLWRHAGFIAINVTFAWVFLKRPAWLVWAFAALTLQIYNGHGSNAWQLWSREARFNLADIVSVLGASLVLIALIVDCRARIRPFAN